jgi:hypothetical protein
LHADGISKGLSGSWGSHDVYEIDVENCRAITDAMNIDVTEPVKEVEAGLLIINLERLVVVDRGSPHHIRAL